MSDFMDRVKAEAERRTQAVAALRAVVDLHRQAAYQRNVPRMLRRTPEDNLPYRPCDGCGEEWPCPTTTAITTASAMDDGGNVREVIETIAVHPDMTLRELVDRTLVTRNDWNGEPMGVNPYGHVTIRAVEDK